MKTLRSRSRSVKTASMRVSRTLEDILPILSDRQRLAVTSAPSLYRLSYARALAGQLSPRQTIKAKCVECVGFEEIKTRVGECTVSICALWHSRPFQDRAGSIEIDPDGSESLTGTSADPNSA